MRTLMLGSSALVSAGLAIGATQAADGVTLTIGGRYMAAAGGLLHEDFTHPFVDEGDLRNYVFKQDVEVHFKGEATLDNGLVVGAKIELEGGTSADQIDEVYAYFRSARFGEIRFGDTLEALSQLCYLVPSASGELFGADSSFFNFSNAGIAGYAATNATCLGIDDKVTKLVYFTQPFTGFTFALSFAPDDTQDTRNTVDGAGTRFRNDLGQNSENLSVAVNYEREIGGVSVIVVVGATWSFDREGIFPFFDLNGIRLPCDAKVDERESYRGPSSSNMPASPWAAPPPIAPTATPASTAPMDWSMAPAAPTPGMPGASVSAGPTPNTTSACPRWPTNTTSSPSPPSTTWRRESPSTP